MKIDKTIINELNRQTVLNVIRQNDVISRAEVSRITGLSIPTVMKIVDNFIQMGLIREIGKGESSGGKPPILLQFVADSYFCVGIDIGATKILGIMADCAANVLYRYECKYDLHESDECFLEDIASVIENVIENASVPQNKILGIGVAMPGLVRSSDHLVVFSPVLMRKNLDLYGYLTEKFSFPIILESVHRSLAMGEKMYGLCQNVKDFLVINLGYGISCGLYLNDQIYEGKEGYAGEFGHIIVNPLGPRCFCGNRGCLESMASALAMTRDAKERIAAHESTIITDLVDGNLDELGAYHIFEAAKMGDTVAVDIVDNAVKYLGIGIASMTSILEPEVIVLTGGVSMAGDYLLTRLVKAWNDYKMNYSAENVQIKFSNFGKDATAIGASSLIFDLLMKKGFKPQKLLINHS